MSMLDCQIIAADTLHGLAVYDAINILSFILILINSNAIIKLDRKMLLHVE